jgi:glutathione S-transferase
MREVDVSAPLLVIGNKRYSSWSLRGWIVLKMLGVSFREERIALFEDDTQARIKFHSPAGRVPVLVDGGLTVHDSLAIMEYANETYGDGCLLPSDPAGRALARSLCAEMHAGFPNLRENLPMNLGRQPAPYPVNEQTEAEISRILSMWEGLLSRNAPGGPYLFGAWSMADCMYLPVATRFRAYGVDLAAYPLSSAYVDQLYSLQAFQEWRADAAKEDSLPQYEL